MREIKVCNPAHLQKFLLHFWLFCSTLLFWKACTCLFCSTLLLIFLHTSALAYFAPHFCFFCSKLLFILLHTSAYFVPHFCLFFSTLLHLFILLHTFVLESLHLLILFQGRVEQRCTGRCHKCHFTNETPLRQRGTAMQQNKLENKDKKWDRQITDPVFRADDVFSYSSCIMRSSRLAE